MELFALCLVLDLFKRKYARLNVGPTRPAPARRRRSRWPTRRSAQAAARTRKSRCGSTVSTARPRRSSGQAQTAARGSRGGCGCGRALQVRGRHDASRRGPEEILGNENGLRRSLRLTDRHCLPVVLPVMPVGRAAGAAAAEPLPAVAAAGRVLTLASLLSYIRA